MDYDELKDLITEGYTAPRLMRNRGVCIHHSYIPSIPEEGKNYAEIFHKYHYENNGWNNDLGYDFVISWWKNNGTIETRYWTSARWILQLNGAYALNPRGKQWDNGKAIIPNKELMYICVTRDYDQYQVPDEVYEPIKDIINKSRVEKAIFLHNEFDYKTCPSKNFDLNKIVMGE